MTDLVKAAAAATAAATGATSKPSTSRAKNVDDIDVDDNGLVEVSLINDNYSPDRVAQVYARHKSKVIV